MLVQSVLKDQVLTLTLHREEKHHALNPSMISELYNHFVQAKSDPKIRVIVIGSSGKTFCAGADLEWMKSSVSMSKDENEESARKLYDMYHAIYTCPKPVIGRIQGNAFGGGVGMIACMDVAIMMDGTSLSLSELKLGLIPSTIAPFLLRKVGFSNLKYYGLCSRRVLATEGKSIGLISDLVSSEAEMDQKISQYVEMFLELSPQAISRYKKMCDDIQFLSIDQAREITSVEIADIRTTPEAQEGLKAFFEKRKPHWM